MLTNILVLIIQLLRNVDYETRYRIVCEAHWLLGSRDVLMRNEIIVNMS